MIRYHFTDKEKLFLDIFSRSEREECISMGGIIMDDAAYPREGVEKILQNMSREPRNGGRTGEEKTSVLYFFRRTCTSAQRIFSWLPRPIRH